MAQEPEPDLETTTATPVSQDPTLVAGRYRILRTLGRGGGGVVWLARDEHLGREVALKKVLGDADTDVLLTRGMREARTSAALAHDHVVRVYDAFEHDDAPWIVMEYVPGPSLAELCEGGRALPPEQVAEIGAQVATALAAAHGAGVLHRDVKPANVLLTEGSAQHAKLTDFGIARSEDDHQLTRTGMVSGTAAFFSPELARGEDPSTASDVWALGATLYTAVEGRRPFPEAPNAVAQLHTIVQQAPREPRRAGPLTPVLAGMLHADPAQRWTARRAAAALREVATGDRPGGAPSAAEPTQVHEPVDSTRLVPVPHAARTHLTAPARSAALGAAAPPPWAAAPRRSRPRWGVVATWVLALPLLAALGWLVWTIAGPQGALRDGTPGGTSSVDNAEPVAAQEAGELARSFYDTLVLEGPEAAQQMLGPDAALDPAITQGLTRVEYDEVTTEPADDGTVAVGLTVRYFYGETIQTQRENLVVARPEAGAQPVIVSRSTEEPVITTP